MRALMGRNYYEKGDVIKVMYFGNDSTLEGTVVDAEVLETQVYSEDFFRVQIFAPHEDENGNTVDYMRRLIKPKYDIVA